MIPPDVASALKLQLPDQARIAAQQPQNQPVASVQRLTDALSNLVPGQRVLAEIQASLPNGTYRAIVAQRNLTLALPFPAKPGDAIELEVAESNGELTLAFVANRTNNAANTSAATESAATSLSSTGKLISGLIGNSDGGNKPLAPVPLSGSQPLVTNMPDNGADLAPVLKQALTQSGMFYEAHQARWLAGEFSTDALKQEPQGKTPVTMHPAANSAESQNKAAAGLLALPADNATLNVTAQAAASAEGRIPQELLLLVRQQLDGLASNNFAWQGQIWPGQEMWWGIGAEGHSPSEAAIGKTWQSRLKLDLPSLGNVDARIQLQADGQIRLSVNTETDTTQTQLRDKLSLLTQQFDIAGLRLSAVRIQHEQSTE